MFASDDHGGMGQGPFTQDSSFVPWCLTAEGDAPPSIDEGPASMANGIGNNVIQSTGSIPLLKQPLANHGEDVDNNFRSDETTDSPWFHGPRLASSLSGTLQSDIKGVCM